ncbi:MULTISPECIES: hypothetical protein [unclassified Micromonospora]|uniref:hypothetical protein n=1 Tax=unclassified Micromonospora TaxID=2617518 RepID=UPI0022C3B678|nr:hypothetical protein [Micromonospora sp. AKA38]GHJ12966.1 hypothetical protein TPA0908_09610 [Micromonospora sp. AKA38]
MLIDDPEAEEVRALSARMRAAWSSFAAHADPGWPAYERDHRLVQCFDASSTVTAYPEESSRLIWENHTFSALPLIGR